MGRTMSQGHVRAPRLGAALEDQRSCISVGWSGAVCCGIHAGGLCSRAASRYIALLHSDGEAEKVSSDVGQEGPNPFSQVVSQRSLRKAPLPSNTPSR